MLHSVQHDKHIVKDSLLFPVSR